MDVKEQADIKGKGIDIDILFQPSIVKDIYQKLHRLQAILRKRPELPLLGILRRVIPVLGIRYHRVLISIKPLRCVLIS